MMPPELENPLLAADGASAIQELMQRTHLDGGGGTAEEQEAAIAAHGFVPKGSLV